MTLELKDDDPMPFGKYKGVKMANVPASYLEWCKNTLYANTDNTRRVLLYINLNWDAIEKELKEEQNKKHYE